MQVPQLATLKRHASLAVQTPLTDVKPMLHVSQKFMFPLHRWHWTPVHGWHCRRQGRGDTTVR